MFTGAIRVPKLHARSRRIERSKKTTAGICHDTVSYTPGREHEVVCKFAAAINDLSDSGIVGTF